MTNPHETEACEECADAKCEDGFLPAKTEDADPERCTCRCHMTAEDIRAEIGDRIYDEYKHGDRAFL